jgi:TetR/AcrR family tetracycline transcriptional repressor
MAEENLDRDTVVAAGLTLLREVGMSGLTMRKLAAALDVKAPTLYWHFPSKRVLLDALAEAIAVRGMASVGTPEPGEPWWDWLARRARAFRESLLGYPDGGLIHAGTTPARRDLSPTVRLVELMTRDGVPRDVGYHAVLTVSRYTVGCVIEQQQASVVEGDENDRFERGLALIIAGVKAAIG